MANNVCVVVDVAGGRGVGKLFSQCPDCNAPVYVAGVVLWRGDFIIGDGRWRQARRIEPLCACDCGAQWAAELSESVASEER